MVTQRNPIGWFEIPTTDLNRAKEFYEHILGVELSLQDLGPLKMAWFPMVDGGTGASGSLVHAREYTPSYHGSLVYFSVDNIEETLKKITEKSGKIINPKSSIGEYGFVAHFEDSEGKRVALHSEL